MAQIELAEELYRRLAARRARPQGQATLGRVSWPQWAIQKEALDICEPLWTNAREVELVAVTCIDILFGSDTHPRTPDPAQVKRVAGWFEQAMAQHRTSSGPTPLLLVGLGNLREQQEDYSEGKELYLRAIKENARNGISLSTILRG